MAKSKLLYITPNALRRWDVWIKATDQHVAILYLQTHADGFRFRLDNYPQSLSKTYKDEKSALAAIEREVL